MFFHHMCVVLSFMWCLARSIILCTVVLVTTDLSVYIYMTLVCRTIPKHECFTDIISDQQTSQSVSGLQLVWHKYWILSGSEPLGCHCTPLPGWRACLLVSGYNSSSPSPSRLLRQITARFTSWSGTEFPTYTPCTSSLPTLLQRVLKDILKERVPALTLHLANCEWAS